MAWPDLRDPFLVQLIGNTSFTASFHGRVCSSLPPKTHVWWRLSSSLGLFLLSFVPACLKTDPELPLCFPPLGFAINHPWVFWGVILPPGAVSEVHLKKNICFSWQSSYLQIPPEINEVSRSKSPNGRQAWYWKACKTFEAAIISTLHPPSFSTRPIAPNSFWMISFWSHTSTGGKFWH